MTKEENASWWKKSIESLEYLHGKSNKDKGTTVGFSKVTPESYDGKEFEGNTDELGQYEGKYLVPQQNVWIRVKDKKPRKGKYVLLYNGHWIGVGKYQPNSELVYEPKWQDETTEYITPSPTHWQPLPKPPKNNL